MAAPAGRPPTRLDTLPGEVVLSVFALLPVQQLCQLSQTNHRLCLLASDRTLWRGLYLHHWVRKPMAPEVRSCIQHEDWKAEYAERWLLERRVLHEPKLRLRRHCNGSVVQPGPEVLTLDQATEAASDALTSQLRVGPSTWVSTSEAIPSGGVGEVAAVTQAQHQYLCGLAARMRQRRRTSSEVIFEYVCRLRRARCLHDMAVVTGFRRHRRRLLSFAAEEYEVAWALAQPHALEHSTLGNWAGVLVAVAEILDADDPGANTAAQTALKGARLAVQGALELKPRRCRYLVLHARILYTMATTLLKFVAVAPVTEGIPMPEQADSEDQPALAQQVSQLVREADAVFEQATQADVKADDHPWLDWALLTAQLARDQGRRNLGSAGDTFALAMQRFQAAEQHHAYSSEVAYRFLEFTRSYLDWCIRQPGQAERVTELRQHVRYVAGNLADLVAESADSQLIALAQAELATVLRDSRRLQAAEAMLRRLERRLLSQLRSRLPSVMPFVRDHNLHLIRYNLACVYSRRGNRRGARSVLQQLAKCHALDPHDLRTDQDLAAFRPEPWFQDLVADITRDLAQRSASRLPGQLPVPKPAPLPGFFAWYCTIS